MADLTVFECRACGQRLAAPAYGCSECGSGDLAETTIPGEGTLYSYTTIYVPPAGFESLVPYTVAVVEVAGGLLLPGRLEAPIDSLPPVGAPVKLVAAGQGYYTFALAG